MASSSEEETVVTNGMSEYARDGENANAALVVSVDASDFGSGVLDGVAFQRRLERQAFVLGGKDYRAPAQSVKSYLEAAAPDLSQAATSTQLFLRCAGSGSAQPVPAAHQPNARAGTAPL